MRFCSISSRVSSTPSMLKSQRRFASAGPSCAASFAMPQAQPGMSWPPERPEAP